MILYLLSGIVQYYLEWLCWTAQLKTTLVKLYFGCSCISLLSFVSRLGERDDPLAETNTFIFLLCMFADVGLVCQMKLQTICKEKNKCYICMQ